MMHESYAAETYTEAKAHHPSASPTLERLEKVTESLAGGLDVLFKRLELVTRQVPTAENALTPVNDLGVSPLVGRLMSTERRLQSLVRMVADQSDALDVP